MASSIPLPGTATEPPQARRLNRNAAIVAGAVLLVTLLVIVFLLTNSPTPDSEGRTAAAQPLPAQPGPAEPGFLDRPPGEVPVPPAIDAAGAWGTATPVDDPAGADPYSTGAGYPPAGDPYAASYTPAPQPSAPPLPSLREQAYQRALQSGILAGNSALQGTSPPPGSWDNPADPYAAQMGAVYGGSTDATPTGTVPGISGVAGFLPNGSSPVGARRATVPTGSRGLAPTTLTYAVQPAPASYRQAAPAAYTLFAGTVIPAMMITGINSDLAGDLLAQVSRNVYSSDQRALLLPKGSRLIGRYDDQITLGQNRLVVAWTRLILPDGRSIAFPGLPTQDPRGASGVRDRVNNHYTRTFGNAALLSAVGAGFQLSQPQQSTVFNNPSAGQVAAAEVGRELSTITGETIRRNMSIKPTIEIRPGTPFLVFLNGDIELAPYHAGS